MRTAYYLNNTDADQYFNDLPYRVFRMEFTQNDYKLYNKQPLVKRKTGISELMHLGITNKDMRKIILYIGNELIRNTINNDIHNWNIQITGTKAGTPDNGFECIEHGVMCLADCLDTLYPFSMEIYDRSIF